ANCVRIVWTMKDGTMEELDGVIEKCLAEKMIPMIELHDATCKWDQELMNSITAYWTDKKMVSIIKKYEKFLLLNFGNEIGTWTVAPEDWENTYIKALKKMRKAGITVPVVIDMPKCGQDMNMLYASAENVQKGDPLNNIIISVHMWWTDGSDERIQDALSSAAGVNVPLIVGEFAHKGVGCAGEIRYKTIMEECEKAGIGWLAWSWGPGNSDCAEMDMTKDGRFDTLYGWGKETAVDHKYSIKNTSKKPVWLINNGDCESK
ncbi:MAG TPA: cellulase family glycosylhydrolase, partial [Candidatus Goldiibacteriota bacterium]|nr:cellulase family glycosylhydrolase [Candidatus Goldiibacteriota bacterium]